MSLEDADEVRITTTIVVEGTSFLDDSVVIRPFDHGCDGNFGNIPMNIFSCPGMSE